LVPRWIWLDPVGAHRSDGFGCDASREGLGERGAQWTEVISWEPRAFVYHNFLVRNAAVALVFALQQFSESHRGHVDCHRAVWIIIALAAGWYR
jgi:hypothetical protein